MGKKAFLAVINDLSSDMRVHKHAMLLTERGYEVTVIGRKLPHSIALQRPYHTHRFELLVNKGLLFYLLFNLRLFFFLLNKSFDVLVANDLDTLGPCYLISRFKKCSLIYDTHEFFTGVPELQHRPLKRKIWEALERTIFPKLNHVITVNQSIAEQYEKLYQKKLEVVRNVSDPTHLPGTYKSRKELGLGEEDFILILQGNGININRGAEELLSALAHTEGVCLLIIGNGDVFPQLRQRVQKEQLFDRVKLMDRLPYAEMMQYTHCSDVGVSLDKPGNPNYEMSLPNKLFDYIHAGIPVLVSDLKEPARIVKQFNIGRICKNHSPEEIAENINFMRREKEQYKQWKANTEKAAAQLSWKEERKTLENIYQEIER
jgi:glycosyltransferase involved in cell wall biosynthesis